jgi:membrane protein implicated in regulation of membrane protease activity
MTIILIATLTIVKTWLLTVLIGAISAHYPAIPSASWQTAFLFLAVASVVSANVTFTPGE